jgi:hypothetical protein
MRVCSIPLLGIPHNSLHFAESVMHHRAVHVQYIVQPESSTFTIHCTTREQYMYNTLYNQRAVHVQSESSTFTTREQYMYNQRTVHVQSESSTFTTREQYMYNQRVVHLQPESSPCTTREHYMYNTLYNQRAAHVQSESSRSTIRKQ